MIIRESHIKVEKDFQLFTRLWTPVTDPKAVIILVHGLSDHSNRFGYVAQMFVKDNIVFFGPDLRGHGLSPGKRGHFESMDQIMNDINAVVNEAIRKFPNKPLFIYGQSMGGNLALNYGFRFRQKIKGVIASSPWLRLTKAPSKLSRMLASLVNPFYPSLLFPDGLNPDDLSHDKMVGEHYAEDKLVHHKISVRAYKVITHGGEFLLANAKEFNIPVLIMHGEEDHITSIAASRQLAENMGNLCQFRSWKGLYHELHNESNKMEVIQFVIQWVNSILAE